MLPRDQFDRRFDNVVAALTAWAETLADVAETTIETAPAFWRLRLEPLASGPCPVEVILHRSQTFDIMVGGEAYEAEPLSDLDGIKPLLAAIVAGDVATKEIRSAASNRLLETATLVGPLTNPLFERSIRSGAESETAITAVKHYPPYRRG